MHKYHTDGTHNTHKIITVILRFPTDSLGEGTSSECSLACYLWCSWCIAGSRSCPFQNKLLGTSIWLYLVTISFTLSIDCRLFQFMYSIFSRKSLHSFFRVFIPFIFSYYATEMVPRGGDWFFFYLFCFLLLFHFFSLYTCYFFWITKTTQKAKNKLTHKYLKYFCS